MCWGANNSGQLGDGTTTNRTTPVDVIGLTNGVSAIATGYGHTCALTSVGGVKCWGRNNYGQLGDGTITNRTTPVDVIGLTSGVSAISAVGSDTCALTSVGGVKCWGRNNYGQLGDGTTTDRNIPAEVIGLAGEVRAISAGEYSTCAVTLARGVMCWGSNGGGELGDGTNTNRSIPAEVIGLTSGVSAIEAGVSHTCVLTTDGGVKCWGELYGGGELGNGANTYFSMTPVDVIGLTSGVSAISTVGSDTCAVTSVGGAKCWGLNDYSQLGDGTNIERTTPVDVIGLTSGVIAISAGEFHTCAVTSVGGAKCWGSNGGGELGDGATTFSSMTPVDVFR